MPCTLLFVQSLLIGFQRKCGKELSDPISRTNTTTNNTLVLYNTRLTDSICCYRSFPAIFCFSRHVTSCALAFACFISPQIRQVNLKKNCVVITLQNMTWYSRSASYRSNTKMAATRSLKQKGYYQYICEAFKDLTAILVYILGTEIWKTNCIMKEITKLHVKAQLALRLRWKYIQDSR
jgi:hypothetical protein